MADIDPSNLPGLTGKVSDESLDEEWSAILKLWKDFDTNMVKVWQDELANLLTFTGLFSAVVTGFIVVVIPKLETDPAEESRSLLAQISQQLSSFTSANDLMNSTFQPSFSAKSFAPDPAVVHINGLWVASLTLSLTTALWTISVQQWLRHIPLPRETAARESIRLRQLRYDGLMRWQVPTIVSFLPIAIQVAVVLFSVGLLLFLKDLNHTVGKSFAVIAGTAFCILFLTIPIPLFSSSCPYKSPLIPAVVAIIQTTGYLIIACSPAYVAILRLLARVMRRLRALAYTVRNPGAAATSAEPSVETQESSLEVHGLAFYATLSFMVDKYIPYLFLQNINLTTFWATREIYHVRLTKWRAAIESSSLASIPMILPHNERRGPLSCLRQLDDWYRVQVVAEWACQDLGITLSDLQLGLRLPSSLALLLPSLHAKQTILPLPWVYADGRINSHMAPLIRLRQSIRVGLPDWSRVLPQDWRESSTRRAFVLTTSLLSLFYRSISWHHIILRADHELVRMDFPTVKILVDHIVAFHNIQMREGRLRDVVEGVGLIPAVWIPSTLLFNCIQYMRHYGMSQTWHFMDYAVAMPCAHISIVEVNSRMGGLRYRDVAYILPGIFALSAIALDAADTSGAVVAALSGGAGPRTDFDVFMHALANFLSPLRPALYVRLLVTASSYDCMGQYFVEQAAVRSIAQSLVRLAEDDRIGCDEDSPTRVIAEKLLEFMKLYDSEHVRVKASPSLFAEGPESIMEVLEEFVQRWAPTSNGVVGEVQTQ